jgi:hypothetical protein
MTCRKHRTQPSHDHGNDPRLQVALSPLLEARIAQAMWSLIALHAWLYGLSKRASTEVGQLIPLLLCRPVFKSELLAFELLYALQQRRFARISRQRALVGDRDLPEQFPDLGINGLTSAQVFYRLRSIAHGLERRGNGGNLG